MSADLERRVEALRRPLELAAADGFKGVVKVKGLGHALRAVVADTVNDESEIQEELRYLLARFQ